MREEYSTSIEFFRFCQSCHLIAFFKEESSSESTVSKLFVRITRTLTIYWCDLRTWLAGNLMVSEFAFFRTLLASYQITLSAGLVVICDRVDCLVFSAGSKFSIFSGLSSASVFILLQILSSLIFDSSLPLFSWREAIFISCWLIFLSPIVSWSEVLLNDGLSQIVLSLSLNKVSSFWDPAVILSEFLPLAKPIETLSTFTSLATCAFRVYRL